MKDHDGSEDWFYVSGCSDRDEASERVTVSEWMEVVEMEIPKDLAKISTSFGRIKNARIRWKYQKIPTWEFAE